MKKMQISLLLLFFAITLNAQIQTDAALQNKIDKIETTKSAHDFEILKDEFIMLSNDKKYGWLPGYYAAVSYYHKGYSQLQNNNAEDLNNSTLTAQKYLSSFSYQNNVEVEILQGLILVLQAKANPAFISKNTVQIKDIIKKIGDKTTNNPRLELLKVELASISPENNGKNSSNSYKSVLEKFENFTPKNGTEPTWGRSIVVNKLQEAK